MIRHLILFSLPFTVLLTFSYPVKGEIFIESGLVDIPTGDVLKHGIFGAGVHATFQNTSHLPRDAVAFRLNFGMFDRVEMGMSQLLLQDKYFSRYALAHLKTLLVAESGMIPSVSIGIENIGDKVSHEWNTYQPQSTFLVISKTFNLPRIHLISGHIGIGNHRFAFDENPIGLFAGVSKVFQPVFARGEFTLNLEYDGAGVNVGARHTANSGLQVALGVETVNKPNEIQYHLAISWTNAKIIEQIASANRLAREAAKLASQTKANKQ